MSKPGTVLQFDMNDKVYRLRSERVTGMMVIVKAKQSVDAKKTMELLHHRFGHLNMHLVNVLAGKLNLGVKLNMKRLSIYDCVACIASKVKAMHHSRLPVRTTRPLDILLMGICSLKEHTMSGSTMFFFVLHVATRYKWLYLLDKKSAATWFILKLLR